MSKQEERLLDLLERWRELTRQGRDVRTEELCPNDPELRKELEQVIRLQRVLDRQGAAAQDEAAIPEALSTGPPEEAVDQVPCAGSSSPVVPGYEIDKELGRGMGVVYRARQIKANRLVALKMILSGVHAESNELARFQREAEALAKLQNPHIVQVHEVGEHQGQPFFSLELCRGGSLEKKLSGTPLHPAKAAQLVEVLARAMQAAHENGILHRDLKPANVLLLEDSTPKITDFGLAKNLNEVGQTASGAVMGTPSYMAPEQASGKKEIGPAADVYALGAILYECLTGRPPFRAATVMETLNQVINEEPVPPRRLLKTPRDLETICLKCLRKDPLDRYVSAAQLAEDLRHFQDGEPILARPISLFSRAWYTIWQSRLDNPVRSRLHILMFLSAAIEGTSHTAIFALRRASFPPQWGMLCGWVGNFFMGLVVAPLYLAAKSEQHKQFFRLLIVNFVGCFFVTCVAWMAAGMPRPFDEVFLYPYWAIINAVCLFAGGALHGFFYLLGGFFFLLAVGMTICPDFAPAIYGISWASILVGLGCFFRWFRK